MRFRKLRKACGKTQADMGKILGISVSGVSDIEAERRNVTEQHLIMLSNWKEKNINIEWLRTGKGEMFKAIPEDDEVASYVSDLLEEDDNPFFDIIIDIMRTYKELDPKSREVLKQASTILRANMTRKKED